MHRYLTSLDGQILNRGFWLYAWKVFVDETLYVYVGRTGDNSSPHAASAFSRLARHLEVKDNAPANSLLKNLRQVGVDPYTARYEMYAFGPVFADHGGDFDTHVPFRDQTAALETWLAEYLRGKGFNVLGGHPKAKSVDDQIRDDLKVSVDEVFPKAE